MWFPEQELADVRAGARRALRAHELINIVAPPGLIEARSHVRPGDSGGAMVNTDGEVIGVTVAYVMSGNKKPTGIGYAIPINQALTLARQLLVDTD